MIVNLFEICKQIPYLVNPFWNIIKWEKQHKGKWFLSMQREQYINIIDYVSSLSSDQNMIFKVP